MFFCSVKYITLIAFKFMNFTDTFYKSLFNNIKKLAETR